MSFNFTSSLPKFDVSFRTEGHLYLDSAGNRFTSVTTLLKDYKPPFDSEYWAAKKAAERGVPKEMVLQEWADKALRSTTHGTGIHKGVEDWFNGTYDWQLALLPERFVRFLATVELQADYWANEYLLALPHARLAGTADFIVFNPATKEFWIYDWKTNEQIKTDNKYQKMRHPLDHLPDCHLFHYTMQLSIYAYMLEKQGWKCRGLFLVHLRDDVRIFPIEYRKTEVVALLGHWLLRPFDARVAA